MSRRLTSRSTIYLSTTPNSTLHGLDAHPFSLLKRMWCVYSVAFLINQGEVNCYITWFRTCIVIMWCSLVEEAGGRVLAVSCCCSWARNAAAIGEYVAVQEPHAQPPISITYRYQQHRSAACCSISSISCSCCKFARLLGLPGVLLPSELKCWPKPGNQQTAASRPACLQQPH